MTSGAYLSEFIGEEETLQQRVHVARRSLILQTNIPSQLLGVPAIGK